LLLRESKPSFISPRRVSIYAGYMLKHQNSSSLEQISRIRSLVKRHHEWRSRCLNLIASENVQSPLVREFMACDLQHRYTNYDKEDPRKRKYAGSRFAKEIDLYVIRLANSIFGSEFAELRAVSGQIADAAVINAFAGGGPVLEISALNGGHAAARRYSQSSVTHVNVQDLPFDSNRYNIDIGEARRCIRLLQPTLIILGAQNFLFPHPVSEIVEEAERVKAIVAYDASHVFGLIAGRQFQDPFKENVHVMMGSTHKTLAGPQGGLILVKDSKALASKIKSAIHPSLITTHHPHRIPGLGVSLLEMKCFGREYARQVVKNSSKLGALLFNKGIRVLFADEGFTRSHTLLIEVSNAVKAQKMLEGANIIVSYTHLPRDHERPTGIRLGVQEVSRLGMKEDDMNDVASTISMALSKRQSSRKVRIQVIALTKRFNQLHFCFDKHADAYKYYPLSNLEV
jgi:glycine hydroxymethyltransferase